MDQVSNHQLSWWYGGEPLKAVRKDSATFVMGLWDQRKLIHLAILKLLVPDIRPDRLLVSAHRRDEISACPEFVSGKVLRLPLDILRNPDRALALDKAILYLTYL